MATHPGTEDLVARLAELCRPRRLEWPPARRARLAHLADTFEALARCRDAAAIHGTAYGLAHPDRDVVAAAADAASRLLSEWSWDRWPVLDCAIRGAFLDARAVVGFPNWTEEPAMVDRLPRNDATRVAGLVLLASHPNGHVRERAVDALDASETPRALPTITVRLDDWVDVIQHKATALWLDWAKPERAALMVDALPLVQQMTKRERVDTDVVDEALSRVFATPEGQRTLLVAVGSRLPKKARAALDVLLRLDDPGDRWLEVALRHRDPTIRFRGARELIATGSHAAISEHLDALAEDRYTPIRFLAVGAAEERVPERLETVLRMGLFDRSQTLRRRCQESLVMDFDVDPVPIYRNALAGDALIPRQRAAALHGLAETAGEEDRPTFEEHLEAETPRVRAAAVRGLDATADDLQVDHFFDHLDDVSPRVARAVESALARRPWTPERFTATFAEIESPAGRAAMVQLSRRLPLWDRVEFLLGLANDDDSAIQVAAFEALALTIRPRAAGCPAATTSQRQAIEGRLRFATKSIGRALAEQIEFMLRANTS